MNLFFQTAPDLWISRHELIWVKWYSILFEWIVIFPKIDLFLAAILAIVLE